MRRLLIRLYPKKWREEYGAEFAEVLASRSLTPGVIADITWSALRHRLLYDDPWRLVGIPLMLLHTGLLLWNILAPWSYEVSEPLVRVPPSVLLLVFGCWVVQRDGTGENHGVERR